MRKELIELRGDNSRRMVAKKLGITPQMIGAIENGKRNPSTKIVLKMSLLYGVSCDCLLRILNREGKQNDNMVITEQQHDEVSSPAQ